MANSFESQYASAREKFVGMFKSLRDHADGMYNHSLNSILADEPLMQALRVTYMRILNFPHLIEVQGKPLTMANPQKTEEYLNHYSKMDASVFMEWFNAHVFKDANPNMRGRILDRAERFFAQWWLHPHGGNTMTIDWSQFDADYEKFTSGDFDGNRYPPVANLYNGIQVAVIETFFEDMAPSDLFSLQPPITH